MNSLGLEEDQPIETKMLTNAIESAQRKVEGRNFGIRKNVLQYDDVMNKQREIIYAQRDKVLNGEDLKQYVLTMLEEGIKDVVSTYLAADSDPADWNLKGRRNRDSGSSHVGLWVDWNLKGSRNRDNGSSHVGL